MNQNELIESFEISMAPVVVNVVGKTQAEKVASVVNERTSEGAIFALLGEKGKPQKAAAEVFGGKNMDLIIRDISNNQYRSTVEWVAGVLMITIVSVGREGYLNLPSRVEEAILGAQAKLAKNTESKGAKKKVDDLLDFKRRLLDTMARGEIAFLEKKAKRDAERAEREAHLRLANAEATDALIKAAETPADEAPAAE